MNSFVQIPKSGTFTLDDEIFGVVTDKNKDTGYMVPFDKDDKDHFKHLKDKDIKLELDQNEKHMEMAHPDKHLGMEWKWSGNPLLLIPFTQLRTFLIICLSV